MGGREPTEHELKEALAEELWGAKPQRKPKMSLAQREALARVPRHWANHVKRVTKQLGREPTEHELEEALAKKLAKKAQKAAERNNSTKSAAGGGQRLEIQALLDQDIERIERREPQIMMGRPFTSSDGLCLVASSTNGQQEEWGALSVDQVLGQQAANQY